MKIKVWITKYALTYGIEEKEAERDMKVSPDMITIVNKDTMNEFYHGEGKEWHLTKESAIKKTEEMRDKKIKSLQKQLEKLQSMKFE